MNYSTDDVKIICELDYLKPAPVSIWITVHLYADNMNYPTKRQMPYLSGYVS